MEMHRPCNTPAPNPQPMFEIPAIQSTHPLLQIEMSESLILICIDGRFRIKELLAAGTYSTFLL